MGSIYDRNSTFSQNTVINIFKLYMFSKYLNWIKRYFSYLTYT